MESRHDARPEAIPDTILSENEPPFPAGGRPKNDYRFFKPENPPVSGLKWLQTGFAVRKRYFSDSEKLLYLVRVYVGGTTSKRDWLKIPVQTAANPSIVVFSSEYFISQRGEPGNRREIIVFIHTYV